MQLEQIKKYLNWNWSGRTKLKTIPAASRLDLIARLDNCLIDESQFNAELKMTWETMQAMSNILVVVSKVAAENLQPHPEEKLQEGILNPLREKWKELRPSQKDLSDFTAAEFYVRNTKDY